MSCDAEEQCGFYKQQTKQELTPSRGADCRARGVGGGGAGHRCSGEPAGGHGLNAGPLRLTRVLRPDANPSVPSPPPHLAERRCSRLFSCEGLFRRVLTWQHGTLASK